MGPLGSALSADAGRPLDFMLASPKRLTLLSWLNGLETPASCLLVPDTGTETQGPRHKETHHWVQGEVLLSFAFCGVNTQATIHSIISEPSMQCTAWEAHHT